MALSHSFFVVDAQGITDHILLSRTQESGFNVARPRMKRGEGIGLKRLKRQDADRRNKPASLRHPVIIDRLPMYEIDVALYEDYTQSILDALDPSDHEQDVEFDLRFSGEQR